ncbi:MAG: LrgB family protein [Lachnospiraceae bacterium]|nr:LrgB family protein [Lachnospiraceae bacterium]
MSLFTQSMFFGVTITLFTYFLGVWIKSKLKLAIFNPLLISIILIILFLAGSGIDYQVYSDGADYISYLITPATVCLALPMYDQMEALKKNAAGVVCGILSGCLTSALCILACSLIFQFNHQIYITLLPKSITTAIGIGLSEEMGGIATVTVLSIIITGIFGNMIAEGFLKLIRVTDPVAKGIAIGTSAHVMGTAKAMELGETEGAMSSLSIAVAGVVTVVVAPLFSMLL